MISQRNQNYLEEIALEFVSLGFRVIYLSLFTKMGSYMQSWVTEQLL